MTSFSVKFPPNPSNDEIFEAIPGLFYQYNSGTNCWVRLDGVESLGLATPLIDGLMSKDDLKKLQNLIIPPPQSTITGEDCNTVFRGGRVALKSFDGSLEITSELQLSGGNPETWQLHNNTVGFDFKLDLDKLIEEIQSRDQFRQVQIEGDQGPRGATGEPGRDRLDTGPVGLDGPDGANSPFAGTLLNDNLALEFVDPDSNRAVIDIATEEVSETENYLVVTRANIGNPDACPSEVIPTNFDTSLGVVINPLDGGGRRANNRTITNGDCSLICRICATSLHGLDLTSIISQVFDHYKIRVSRLKKAKEDLVRVWLRVMLELFNEQKSALCCALENCKSRNRNLSTRQFIDAQRIQAAQGGFSLIVDGDDKRQYTNMNEGRDCPVPTPTASINPVSLLETGAIYRVDSRINVADPRLGDATKAVSANLPAATYEIKITDCCANLKLPTSRERTLINNYSGRVAILYRVRTTVNNSEVVNDRVITFDDLGVFQMEAEAKNAYQSQTLTIEHAGGTISAWVIDPDGFSDNNSGFVELTFTDLATQEEEDLTVSPSNIYVYREELSPDRYIGRIAPYVTGLTAAENYNLDMDGNAAPISGPTLENETVYAFFSLASDGFFVNLIGSTLISDSFQFAANGEAQIQIDNSSLPADVVVDDGIASRLASNLFNTRFNVDNTINNLTGGVVIGPIDSTSDYSVSIDPINFGAFTSFLGVGPSVDDLTLARNDAGIGGQTSELFDDNGIQLFSVCNVPEGFDAECGLEIVNELPSQNVIITRPITLDPPDFCAPPTTPDSSIPQPIPGRSPEPDLVIAKLDPNLNPGGGGDERFTYWRPSKAYYGPGSSGALPWGKLYVIENNDSSTRRIVDYDPNTGEIDDPLNPGANLYATATPEDTTPDVETIVPRSEPVFDPNYNIASLVPIDEGTAIDGDPVNPEDVPIPSPPDSIIQQIPALSSKPIDPSLVKTNPDVIKDPCVQDITVTFITPAVQSIRYVLTDVDGVKFYSAFVSTQNTPLNSWGFLSLGPPIRAIAPPSVFNQTSSQDGQVVSVVSDKRLNLELIRGLLTNDQFKVAESLDGISRLTYVQSLLGYPVNALAVASRMTDIEIEVQGMPATTLEFGVVKAVVGIRTETSELVIDDFEKPDIPVPKSLVPTEGSLKRVVATLPSPGSGRASQFSRGGMAAYFGDHVGHPKVDPTANAAGNNFFVYDNRDSKFTQITSRAGFGDLIDYNGQLINARNPTHTVGSGGFLPPPTGLSANIDGDALVIDDLGVLYVADGSSGTIYAIYYSYANVNRTFGDASYSIANGAAAIATGLPATEKPVMTLGRRKMVGSAMVQEVVANFGDQWYQIDSPIIGAVWQRQGRSGFIFKSGRIRVGTRNQDAIAGRCCGFKNPDGTQAPAGNVRMVAYPTAAGINNYVTLASGPAGNSLATDRDFRLQPTLPAPTNQLNQSQIDEIQVELDRDFNSFNYYTMEGNVIYRVIPSTGERIQLESEQVIEDGTTQTTEVLPATMPVNGFNLRIHPNTKNFYYIAADRDGQLGTSGTRIMKFTPTAAPSAQHSEVWRAPDGEGIYAIAFLPTVPNELGSPSQALTSLSTDFGIYALKSNLPQDRFGSSDVVNWELVEIAETPVAPRNDPTINTTWSDYGTGGAFQGPFANPNKIIFSKIPPGIGCRMHYKQVQWYERGWRIGACCGAWVENDGVQWLIIKRSIGVDTTCGGGESLNTPCISQYIDLGDGHPAIAWPTIDGEEFLGIPNSGFVSFVKDDELSTALLSVISNNLAEEIMGNPSSEIPFILFPAM